MKLSCSAYQAGSSYAQKILSGHMQNYGSTSTTSTSAGGDATHGLLMPSWQVEEIEVKGSPNEAPDYGNENGTRGQEESSRHTSLSSHSDLPPDRHSDSTTSKTPHASTGSPSESPANRLSEQSRTRSKSVGEQHWTNLRAVMTWYGRLRRIKRTKSNQRWMKLRTTVQLSGAISSTIQKKAPLKREDSFLKRFSTRQAPEAQETFELGDEDGVGGSSGHHKFGRKKRRGLPRSVVNPDGNFYFYWLMLLAFCVLYNLWTLIVRQSFPELQAKANIFWIVADAFCDVVFLLDIAVQFRTGYLEQGLMVYKTKKLADHYVGSKHFYFDVFSLTPTDFFQFWLGTNPMFRFPRFLKIYRVYNYYYMVESRTVYPNCWRVVNLIHILLLLAHWFGCFYYLLSEAEDFIGPWVYPDPKNPNNTAFTSLTRKYLGSLYWSTLTLTTIGDLPTPYSNWQLGSRRTRFDISQLSGFRSQAHKSRLLYIKTNRGYLFTIVSYLIGVFIFATIVGQVGNVITNRNANRLEFERLLDGAKMYMRHHRVPREMQRRVLRWYDYSWSRGRIQGGGDINTALGLLPDKLKTELALHVNLSVLKKVTIFQECQPEFLHDLVLKMKAYIFTPGDLICRKGEVAREMFIIADGILEVISEIGKVLTTMQAGDFFGEIGILNLDGLNKRTADVRSVGYSELFSLSREDVLAAMKDYPEAQEILQTLGRKRLMEARKASGPSKKVVSVSESKKPILSHSHSSHSTKAMDAPISNEAVSGKRIVEKLRSDVKGLKSAIRRSRKSSSSRDDSSEPESVGKEYEKHTGRLSRKESVVSQGSPKSSTPRGVLKRMQNVLSDEKEKDGGGTKSPTTTSPLRTQFSKKVQLALGGSSKQEEASTKPHEVIGAGLPLIQRLRLLKQKEERERKQQEEREAMLQSLVQKSSDAAASTSRSVPTTSSSAGQDRGSERVLKTAGSTAVSIFPFENKDIQRARDSVSSVDSFSTSLSSPPSFSILSGHSMSFPQRKDSIQISEPEPPEDITDSSPSTVIISTPVVRKKICSLEAPSSTPIHVTTSHPSLRPAALHFRKKTYGSVDDLSPEFSRLPFIKKLKILNERQKIAQLLMTKCGSSVLTRSTSEGSNEPQNPQISSSYLNSQHLEDNLHSLHLGRRSQSNTEYISDLSDESMGSQLCKRIQSISTKVDHSHVAKPLATGAPDVKSSRSFKSLSPFAPIDPKVGREVDSGAVGPFDKNEVERISKDACSSSLDGDRDGGRDGESNETPERRNLKSILKKLAAESDEDSSVPDSKGSDSKSASQEYKEYKERQQQLLRAPTIEGYAARHRRFSKTVTFNKDTVSGEKENGVEDQSEEYVASQNDLGRQSPTEESSSGQTALRTLEHTSPENMKKLTQALLTKDVHAGDLASTLTIEALKSAQEECVASVLIGVKAVIQSKLDEVQMKFQQRFDSLQQEVRQRDEIISILQRRIHELEKRPEGEEGRVDGVDNLDDWATKWEGESKDITGEWQRSRIPSQSSFLFYRDDSVDTVISNQDYEDDVFEQTDEIQRDLNEEQGYRAGGEKSSYDWSHGDPQDEGIESEGYSAAPWQLEFHRDKDSLPPPNRSKSQDIVLHIESSSSSESESSMDSQDHGRGGYRPTGSSTQMYELKTSFSSDDGNDLEDDEHDDEENKDERSQDSLRLDNQNWEVQMLARELDRREEEKEEEKKVIEFRKLEQEITEMKKVVSQESLSPTELDMLESLLQSKKQKVKALSKAFSVESCQVPVPERKLSLQMKGQMSYDESSSEQQAVNIGRVEQVHGQVGSSSLFNPPRSRLNLKSLIGKERHKSHRASVGEAHLAPSSVATGSEYFRGKKWSSFSSGSHQEALPSEGPRRESTGTIFPSSRFLRSKTSLLTKLNIVKQFTSRSQSREHPEDEAPGTIELKTRITTTTTATTTTETAIVQQSSSSSQQPCHSSRFSETPGYSGASYSQSIFTIPSSSASSSKVQPPNESQPLLKK